MTKGGTDVAPVFSFIVWDGTGTVGPPWSGDEPAQQWLWVAADGYSEPAAMIQALIRQASGRYCCIIRDIQALADVAGVSMALQQVLESGSFDLVALDGVLQWGLDDASTLWRQADEGAPQAAVCLSGPILAASRQWWWRHPLTDFADEAHSLFETYTTAVGLYRRARLGVAAAPPSSRPERVLPRLRRRFAGHVPFSLSSIGVWQRNLQALQTVEDTARAWLDGFPELPWISCRWLGQGAVELADARGQVAIVDPEPDWRGIAGRDALVCCGAGNGRVIAEALEKMHGPVVVIEPARPLLRCLLHRYDWSAAIREGRLRLVAPPLDQGPLTEIALREAVAVFQRLLRHHGAVHLLGTGSLPLHAGFFQQFQSAVQYSATMDRIRRHRIPAEPCWDVTVISPECAIFHDLAACFERLGLRCRLVNVPDVPRQWSREQRFALMQRLINEPARLTVQRNRCFLETEVIGEAVRGEAALAGTVVNWWWDQPNVASFADMREHEPDDCVNVAFARAMLPLMRSQVEWLPPAARMAFVEALRAAPPAGEAGVTFVGQSRVGLLENNLNVLLRVLDTLTGVDRDGIERRIQACRSMMQLHEYLSVECEPILEKIATLRNTCPVQYHLLWYLWQMSVTAAFRLAAVERLSRAGIAVTVYGDQGWLRSGACSREQFRGQITAVQLPDLYRRSALNLNLNFMQVASTVNPKVLDICACGGVALSDYRPELVDLFPQPQARPFSFRSLEELPEVVSDLLRSDLSDHRQRVAEQVNAQHTLMHRAIWLAERFGLPLPDGPRISRQDAEPLPDP